MSDSTVAEEAPVWYIARITVIDPTLERRDQTDPWRQEPIAVLDGQQACSDGHATVEDAEKWARDLLRRTGSSLQFGTLRLAVLAAGKRALAGSGRGAVLAGR
ncbi:hypothetical protein AB0B10_26055 [Micromonospora arborensis]|uniref:hypothetical protein n=1 Tax=Micromonospora arborensis TaxID=2116518 RepID=UPI0033E528A4